MNIKIEPHIKVYAVQDGNTRKFGFRREFPECFFADHDMEGRNMSLGDLAFSVHGASNGEYRLVENAVPELLEERDQQGARTMTQAEYSLLSDYFRNITYPTSSLLKPTLTFAQVSF